MHLVIDAYNLIHHTFELQMADDGAENGGQRALCMALNLYRKRRGHKVTAVFDGGQEPAGGRATLHGVPVVFSGHNRTADEVIIAMAKHQGPGMTVITDDRDLADQCRAQGAEVIGSREFGPKLMAVAYNGQGVGGEEDGWDFTTKKKGPKRRLPKSKRRKERRLKRL